MHVCYLFYLLLRLKLFSTIPVVMFKEMSIPNLFFSSNISCQLVTVSGNGTMEKLQQFFTSGQKYGDLTLDLHCNRFGPTALFQV